MGKIIPLHDPWANLVVPYPEPEAGRDQLFEFATLTLLNAIMRATPGDEQGRQLLRRTTVAYLEEWHPKMKRPPL